jgi:S1-C subfamily serine protease
MKKVFLAMMAVVLTACTTVPSYRSLAKQVVPTNVEMVATLYDLDTGETKEDTTYCSGVAVSKTRVITAGHCTEAAKSISLQRGVALTDGNVKLRLSNGKLVFAKILVSESISTEKNEEARDVALLEIIDGEAPAVAVLGDSDMVAVGDQLAIVGNTFGELTYSFTIGVVSFVGRQLSVGTFIQTDALAGPGNSGGPVFDMDGQLIGILTRGGGGVSLAIPINDQIKHIHEALKKNGL